MMAETQLAILFTSIALVVIGLYAAIFVDNIIKKIIGISFIEEGANLFIVGIGYKAGGIVLRIKCILSITLWFSTYKYSNWGQYPCSHACFSNGSL